MATKCNIDFNNTDYNGLTARSFDDSICGMESVKNALIDHSRVTEDSEQRRFLTKIYQRVSTLQDYWQQLQRDYHLGQDVPRSNVKTFVEVVKDASYNKGYDKGIAETQNTAYNDGFAAGFEAAYDDDDHSQIKHNLKWTFVGFITCLAFVLLYINYR